MNNKSVSSRTTLSGGARRLLAALAEPGAAAIPDPTRDGGLILRGGRRGVSLGRGLHKESAAAELANHDLVETRASAARPERIITDAGRALLRRAASTGEGNDAFRDQHIEVVAATIPEADGPARVSINAAESPLDWLRRRKGPDGRPLIDAACYEAGERLRRDLTLGGLLPSVTARWDGAAGQGRGALRDPAAATDTMIAARQRVRAALEAIGGEFADLLIDLCGFLKGLEVIERDRGWPARSGKVVLRLALARLAAHYGLETEARGPARSRGLRSWSDAEIGV